MTNGKIRRVCILTGGGDAPGLNAVIEGFVTRACRKHGWEVLGSEDGFEGLVQPPAAGKARRLEPAAVAGISSLGGSVLGCSNVANPWSYPKKVKGETVYADVHRTLVKHVRELGIDALVLVGGDGTMTMAQRFMALGVPAVGVPKTIDNDLSATDCTFGFDTALATATWAVDKLHSTAHAHDRVMIAEVMGRYAGWIAMESGIASHAHCILVPEIPYGVDRIVAKIRSRGGRLSSYAVIVCSEGAREKGGDYSTDEKVVTTKDGKIGHLPRLSGAGQHLADLLKGKIHHEIRVTVLGHVQRGGSPSAFDRILGLRFGVAAAELVARRGFGRMVALRTPAIVDVPFEDAIGKPKLVDPGGELAFTARALGIELGG